MREVKIRVYYEPENRNVTLTELANITKIRRVTIYYRYKKGDRGERLWCPVEEYDSKYGNPQSVYAEYNNKKVTIRELSELTGLPLKLLHSRYEKGDRGEDLIRPIGMQIRINTPDGYIDYYGEMITLEELSRRTGIKRTTLSMRYKKGDRGERLWRPTRPRTKKVPTLN